MEQFEQNFQNLVPDVINVRWNYEKVLNSLASIKNYAFQSFSAKVNTSKFCLITDNVTP